MPEYRRPFCPGGTWFLTLVTHERRPILTRPHARVALRESIKSCQSTQPFELVAIVLLPDHLHLMMELPTGEHNVSTRMGAVKANFSRRVGFIPPFGSNAAPEADGGMNPTLQSRSRSRQGYRPVWQKRFHDHLIRDEHDFEMHLDYLVYNPVHHGLATCPHVWPYSSFGRLVKEGVYEADWSCCCGGKTVRPVPKPRSMSE